MSKTRLGLAVFLALFVGFFAFQAKALMVQNKESLYVAKDEVISSSYVAAGSTITIDGKIQGDVICAGRSIIINGFVDGDVLCLGQTITINGEVRGSVRAIGSSVVINGKVARNVTVAGSDVGLGSKGEVGWDMMFASAYSDIRGAVKRDIDGAGAIMTIGGLVGRNVNLFGDRNDDSKNDKNNNPTITIAKEAVINGNLSYTATQDALVEEGAMIKGSTDRHDFALRRSGDANSAVAAYIWWRIIVIFSALLVGLILISWLKRPLHEISQKIFVKPYATFGYGLLFIIVTPIISILLMFTFIGIPLALMMSAIWLIVLYLGKIITAIIVGQEIMKRRKQVEGKKSSAVLAMVVGVVVSYLIFSIPVLGGFMSMLATIFGVGLIWIYGREKSVIHN
ncbi:polymer-forming cytoskeletal protein [Candidatus Falkowbacteria bacterium]|nr:MAG: polymer-forming cytoskeletal protein [Candidatus Falkowbacteria bacterium]